MKVLYLHGMEKREGNLKHALLNDMFGIPDVINPDLETAAYISNLMTTLLITMVLYGLGFGYIFMITPTKYQIFISVAAFLCNIFLLYIICVIYVRRMLSNAIRIAQCTIDEDVPDIIIASSFGSVISSFLQWDEKKHKKPSIILFSPGIELYNRLYFGPKCPPLSEQTQFSKFVILHGNKDNSIPYEDSVKLKENAIGGNVYLEVVESDHSLITVLTAANIQRWIDIACSPSLLETEA